MRYAPSSGITDALTALEGALHQANAGVIEQALARPLDDDESLALLHRLAGSGRRIGLVGDGVVFVGAGVAVDLATSGRACLRERPRNRTHSLRSRIHVLRRVRRANQA